MLTLETELAVEAGCRVFPQLLHSSWAGFHFADSVFPAFVVMSV